MQQWQKEKCLPIPIKPQKQQCGQMCFFFIKVLIQLLYL